MKNSPAQQHRTGTVLIIVVVIVMLLSLVAYKFLLSMQTEHMAAALSGDRLQAEQSAHSACDLLTHLLKKSRAERDALGGLSDNPSYFAGNTTALNDTSEMASVAAIEQTTAAALPSPFGLIAYALPHDETNRSGESRLGTSDTTPASTRMGSSLQLPLTRYGAINESQKLHLSKLLQWEEEMPGAGVAALMMLPGMDEGTAEALLDWLDADNDPRASGAEADFYATLTRPIAPRNGMPFELDELLFVKGITPLRLYATQTELPMATTQGMASPAQPSSRERFLSTSGTNSTTDSTSIRPWVEYLTIHSAERNESYTGQPRIFINGANLQEVHAELTAKVSKRWADFVVLYRQFGANSDSTPDPAQTNDDAVTISFEVAPQVVVESLLDLIGSSVSIPTQDDNEEPQIVNSPVDSDSIAVNSDLARVLDLMTINPEKRIVGRLNINEAPPEVIATLPGLSEQSIDAILSARDRENEETASRVHPIWLVSAGIVELPSLRVLLPYLTCGGDVYRAEVWGRAEAKSAMFRFETVLDASTKTCRPVYYRELNVPKDAIKIFTDTEFAALGITSPGTESGGF